MSYAFRWTELSRAESALRAERIAAAVNAHVYPEHPPTTGPEVDGYYRGEIAIPVATARYLRWVARDLHFSCRGARPWAEGAALLLFQVGAALTAVGAISYAAPLPDGLPGPWFWAPGVVVLLVSARLYLTE